MDTVEEIKSILRTVFVDPTLAVDRQTTAADVPGWDSLSHVRLLMTIERQLKIRFAPLEADRLKNVGDLVDLIDLKIEARS